MPQSPRWTEDWKAAADLEYRKKNPLESLRHVPLVGDDVYLSVGGELRYYYQNWSHQSLGAAANDSNQNLGQRLRLVTDLHVTPYLRIFSELGHNKEYDATQKTPPNRDKLEFQQIFADITVPIGDDALVTLRPGRFEMPLGNGKLVGLRDGTNVCFTYQGVPATFILKYKLRIDAFAVRPMQLFEGSFDDKANPDRHFNGVTISAAKGLILADTQIDIYHYDVFNKVAKFALLTGEEHRPSWACGSAAGAVPGITTPKGPIRPGPSLAIASGAGASTAISATVCRNRCLCSHG